MGTKPRGKWGNWFEFILSCIGCIVGLGSIWRFPYVCYKNGGGSFMIPYLLFSVITAVPMVFAELSYSQYSNLGPGKIWICCPLFKGIGFGMVMLNGIVSLYYNVILAWSLFYLGMSFFPTIPWSHCDGEWNTKSCYQRGKAMNQSYRNTTLHNSTEDTLIDLTKKTATEEFWEYNVLQISDGIDFPGSIRWQLLLCLMAAWLLTFLCLMKGIKSMGKVVYIVSTVPYIFLIILLVRGLTLPGAIDGLKYYVIPHWSDLTKLSLWVDAAVQVAYSSDLGWGGLVTLASYSDFNNNCYRDALILPIINFVTSWFAGCVLFVTLGFMATELNISIPEVVQGGPGIAFIAYPEALSRLPLPQLWSVLFFLMFFIVGLDSQIVHLQTIISALSDNFPKKLNRRKTVLTGVICSFGFLLGIPCITQGGIYLLTIIDWYCASISIMILAFLEITLLAWVYGADRLMNDIELMIGYKPNKVWIFLWKVLTPSSILFIWIGSIVKHQPVSYGQYQFPTVAIVFGWFIGLTSLLPIPIGMLHTLYHSDGSLLSRLKHSIKPSPEWKPAIPINQTG